MLRLRDEKRIMKKIIKKIDFPNGGKCIFYGDVTMDLNEDVVIEIFARHDSVSLEDEVIKWCKENHLFCFLDHKKGRYHFVSSEDYDIYKFTLDGVWFKSKKEKSKSFGIFSTLQRLI